MSTLPPIKDEFDYFSVEDEDEKVILSTFFPTALNRAEVLELRDWLNRWLDRDG